MVISKEDIERERKEKWIQEMKQKFEKKESKEEMSDSRFPRNGVKVEEKKEKLKVEKQKHNRKVSQIQNKEKEEQFKKYFGESKITATSVSGGVGKDIFKIKKEENRPMGIENGNGRSKDDVMGSFGANKDLGRVWRGVNLIKKASQQCHLPDSIIQGNRSKPGTPRGLTKYDS